MFIIYINYFTEDEHVFNSNPELAAGGYETTNSMENVREIIEKIVESLVGNVDNTPIDRLYTHEACKLLFNYIYSYIYIKNKKFLNFSICQRKFLRKKYMSEIYTGEIEYRSHICGIYSDFPKYIFFVRVLSKNLKKIAQLMNRFLVARDCGLTHSLR